MDYTEGDVKLNKFSLKLIQNLIALSVLLSFMPVYPSVEATVSEFSDINVEVVEGVTEDTIRG